MVLFNEYMKEFQNVTQGDVATFKDMTHHELKGSTPVVRSRLFQNKPGYGDMIQGKNGSEKVNLDTHYISADNLPDGWEAHEDDNTGKKYFYSSKRRVSVWSTDEINKLK